MIICRCHPFVTTKDPAELKFNLTKSNLLGMIYTYIHIHTHTYTVYTVYQATGLKASIVQLRELSSNIFAIFLIDMFHLSHWRHFLFSYTKDHHGAFTDACHGVVDGS